MKTKLIAGLLLAASCVFAAPRIAIGIGVGVPVAPYVAPAPVYVAPAPAYVAPAPVVAVPPMPGPGYSWVAGYWVGHAWHPGYWAAPRAHAYVRGGWRR